MSQINLILQLTKPVRRYLFSAFDLAVEFWVFLSVPTFFGRLILLARMDLQQEANQELLFSN